MIAFKIINVRPFAQSQMVAKIAEVYQQAFGDKPWNEGLICPICGSLFSRNLFSEICPKCVVQSKEVLLVEYWPMSKIINDFYQEMNKPLSVCIVALIGKDVIGFAWGYQVNVNLELEVNLEAPGLHRLLCEPVSYFYLDECAVLPTYQGRGLGKLLVKNILRQQALSRVILRTMDDSRMCDLIKKMGGKIVQNVSRNRVIMQLATP